jgi:uncharacterized iron-regulated membrane protein
MITAARARPLPSALNLDYPMSLGIHDDYAQDEQVVDYAQLSTEAQADPSSTKLAATVSKGETLRGLRLNAYAFGAMGTIAGIAAVGAFLGALIMLTLSGLGLWHSRRDPDALASSTDSPAVEPIPVGAH